MLRALYTRRAAARQAGSASRMLTDAMYITQTFIVLAYAIHTNKTPLLASCNALAVDVLGVRRMYSNALHVLRNAWGTVTDCYGTLVPDRS